MGVRMNKQSLNRRIPKKKRKAKIAQKKTVYDGIEFDSLLEREYYKHLKEEPGIADIQLHPEYTLQDSFTVDCDKCRGQGRKVSPKTGNLIKCSSCKGSGESPRQKMIYTADFKIIYDDGYEEIVDVKGGFANERFPIKKKLFEYKYRKRLFVVTRGKDGKWIKK